MSEKRTWAEMSTEELQDALAQLEAESAELWDAIEQDRLEGGDGAGAAQRKSFVDEWISEIEHELRDVRKVEEQ